MNVIKSLRREGGGVVEGEKELGLYISNHYKSLFTSSVGTINDELLQHVPKSVTDDMNVNLCAPFSEKEVSDALFQIGPLKAPGPDGFPARFLQRN